MINRPELGPLVTFTPNKRLPVYSWYHYKEGFSRDFVMEMFREFDAPKDEDFVVLDPFMGAGTTLLASMEYGVTSYGFDAMELPVFVSKVKTRRYDIDELVKWEKWLFNQKFEKVKEDVSGIVKRAFNPHTLDDILFFKMKIDEMPEKYRDFYKLGLMVSSNKCSYAFKDGAAIKFRKRNIPPLRTMLKRTVKRMISDIKRINLISNAYANQGDARDLNLDDESINMIITSPPYLNKIEYTKVYKIENELFFGKKNKNLISSALGQDVRITDKDMEELGVYLDEGDPIIAYKYFKDMKLSLEEMYRVLKDGGIALIVVGNGCFPHRVIESDVILSEIGEKIGFNTLDIWVANQRTCTYERVKKVGLLRESVLVMKK